MRRVLLVVLGVVGVLGVVFALGPRVELKPPEVRAPVPAIGELDDWLAKSEAAVGDITPGAERAIVWADPASKARTPLSVVYLHGFTATRAEVAPLADRVAAALGANLYYARLAGHGRPGAALGEVHAGQWLADAIEALAIGERLGERVVLMGGSTGASLAIWLAAHAEARASIEALVLMSPNFGPRDRRGWMLTWPWGAQILDRVQGAERSWTPRNEGHGRYWTTRYPSRVLLEMMALVDVVDDIGPEAIDARALVIWSPHDPVVESELSAAWVAEDDRRTGLRVDDSIEGGDHVLAGDILAPARTARFTEAIVAFVRGG